MGARNDHYGAQGRTQYARAETSPRIFARALVTDVPPSVASRGGVRRAVTPPLSSLLRLVEPAPVC